MRLNDVSIVRCARRGAQEQPIPAPDHNTRPRHPTMALPQRIAYLSPALGGWRFITFLLPLFVLILIAGPLMRPAWAQNAEVRELIQRLQRIESAMQDVQREVFRSNGGRSLSTSEDGTVPRSRTGASEVRVSEIEGAMSELTASIELIGRQVDVLEDRLDKLVGDIDFRLSQIEQSLITLGAGTGLSPAPAGAAARPAPLATTETAAAASETVIETEATGGVLPDGTPEERYAFARSLLTRLNYESAQVAFAEFLAEHGDHALAGNAQYWLGETYYVRGNYSEAASAFIEGYQKFPEGSKAPDNLLKLGMSLAALEQKSDACATFAELLSRFEDADGNLTRRATQEQARLEC